MESFRYHVFGPPLAGILAVALAGRILARNRPPVFRGGALRNPLVRCVLAAWMTWAVIRNLA